MKIRGFISLGLQERSDELEIPDEDLKGLSSEEREKLIYEYLNHMYQFIDLWYEVID